MDLITLALAKKGSGGNSSSSGRTTLVSFTREGQSLDSPIKLATPATYQELLDSIERHDEIFVVSSFGSRSFNSKPIDICVDTERNFIILNYINKIDNTEYKCTATIASDGQIWYESKMAPGIKYLRFIDGSTLNIQDPENNWSDVRASAMRTWINGGYTLILIDSEHQYSVSGTYKYGGDIYGVYFSGIYDERVSSNLTNHYIRTIFVSDSNITKTDIPIPASTELTPATATELGGIKVGDGLSIDSNGVLSTNTSGSILIVRIDEADTPDTYVADKSIDEIIAALQSGVAVYAYVGDYIASGDWNHYGAPYVNFPNGDEFYYQITRNGVELIKKQQSNKIIVHVTPVHDGATTTYSADFSVSEILQFIKYGKDVVVDYDSSGQGYEHEFYYLSFYYSNSNLVRFSNVGAPNPSVIDFSVFQFSSSGITHIYKALTS